MSATTHTETERIWTNLVESFRSFQQASKDFVQCDDRLDALRKALRGPDRVYGLEIARSLPDADFKQLLPELVNIARSAHGPFQAAWNILMDRIPRDWLLQHLPQEIDRILDKEDEADYWMFLNLAIQINRDLTRSLATRASASSDADIKEHGEDFLRRLAE